MAEMIIMPKLGINMDEGNLVKWHKKVGDKIEKGEVFFEIETDKTSIGVEATLSGFVNKLMLNEGESVPVFTPIAIIGQTPDDLDAEIPQVAAESAPTAAEAAPAKAEDKAVAPVPTPSKADDKGGDYQYDAAVIGAGPGGYVAAIRLAQEGKKVCIIEKEYFGGTCLNVGCIPTKTLLKSIAVLDKIKEAGEFGIKGLDKAKPELDLEAVQKRKTKVVKSLTGGVEGLMKANKIETIKGTASLVNKNAIKIGSKEITARDIIIATGSVSMQLPIVIAKDANVITSTEALDMKKAPADIVIIGGGVIGVEFAYVYSSVGSKVTIIELLDRILPMVDEEVSAEVTKMLKNKGIDIITSAKVEKIDKDKVHYDLGGKKLSVKSSQVLMSVGRKPNTDGLNLEGAGVKLERGAVVTDEFMRTNIPNIYAIGDVNGKSMLAHTASAEGMVAVDNICGRESKMKYDAIPSCIYVQPEIAAVGLTEKQAKEKYGEIRVGKFPVVANGKAMVEGETGGMIKIITDARLGEILGAHIYAVDATNMISEIALAMNLEATDEEVAKTIHPHPTVSEIIPEAFLALHNKAIHSH